MEFIRSNIYFLVTLAAIASFAGYFFVRSLKNDLSLFTDSLSFNFDFSKRNAKSKALLGMLGVLSLLIAAFGPVADIKNTFSKNSTGNIVFLFDVSKSMNAQDVEMPDGTNVSRFQIAKKAVDEYVTSHSYDNYAIVAFAGEAVTISPFTQDTDQILNYIDGLSPSSVSVGGSDIPGAILHTLDAFSKQKNLNIILLSDGDTDGNPSPDMSRVSDFQKKDFYISTAGIGTEKGAYIPNGTDIFGNILYKTYDSERVVTKLSEDPLKEISSKFSGKYVHLQKQDDLEKLNIKIRSEAEGRSEIETRGADIGYQFIVFSFICLLTTYLLPDKKLLGKRK